ncbi:NEK kinase [Toxoplasma gondii RUB]|uniref:non-specific serine/threonine protein kinase n=2 Tax=Toxoplasma gondii TaxID=5811 RepID=A0A086LPY3_TOXGO|nr:NEK kinase [Toxoplasma gondii RUB]RQX67621.1 NEK kinase [Toxoplasma gondii CAST]
MPVYKKVRLIGSGSFGRAYLVRDKDDAQKLYVMKLIDISQMDGKTRDDTFNEAKVLSTLKPHPFIVRYHQSYIYEDHLCIIMDFAAGGDIAARIKEQKKTGHRFDESLITRWIAQACLGLNYLHSMHILHRDLKPQNLFLTANDDLQIGDFGIAKILESPAACAQTTIGTPYYLSPEICRGQSYSLPSDIWSLGCILYELASFTVPFHSNDLKGLVDAISELPVPAVPSVYSDDLRQLCNDMLNRDPSKRPTAAQILRMSPIKVCRFHTRTKRMCVCDHAAVVNTKRLCVCRSPTYALH